MSTLCFGAAWVKRQRPGPSCVGVKEAIQHAFAPMPGEAIGTAPLRLMYAAAYHVPLCEPVGALA
jgi:hypothetical protein